MPLQIRRGLSSQMTSSVTPELGEPIYTTDTEKLYIGDGSTTADVLTPVNPDTSTTDLSDVSSGAASNGQFLLYDSTTSSYLPTDAIINSLTDVNITSVANGETLTYDSATSKWINSASGGGGTLSGLSDTNITSVANGQTLVYDSATSKWINSSSSGGGTVSGLSDTDITSLANNQMLVYDSSTGKWVNDTYARGLSTTEYVYIGNSAQIEAISSNVSLSFTNGSGVYAGIEDNVFSTGSSKQVLTADGNGGLNWEQVLLENAAGGTLVNAVDDSAAASGGVAVGGIYRDGSTLKVRVS